MGFFDCIIPGFDHRRLLKWESWVKHVRFIAKLQVIQLRPFRVLKGRVWAVVTHLIRFQPRWSANRFKAKT